MFSGGSVVRLIQRNLKIPLRGLVKTLALVDAANGCYCRLLTPLMTADCRIRAHLCSKALQLLFLTRNKLSVSIYTPCFICIVELRSRKSFEWTFYEDGYHYGKRCYIDGERKGNCQSVKETTLVDIIGRSRKGMLLLVVLRKNYFQL